MKLAIYYDDYYKAVANAYDDEVNSASKGGMDAKEYRFALKRLKDRYYTYDENVQQYITSYDTIVEKLAGAYDAQIREIKPANYEKVADYKSELQSMKRTCEMADDEEVLAKITLYPKLDELIENAASDYADALWSDKSQLEAIAVKVAEAKLKNALRNPSSYNRIRVSTRI